jgi:hypothetical protein
MEVVIEIDDEVKAFLERYAESEGGTLGELLRNLLVSHARRLLEQMPAEERADLLGVGRLFR